MMISLCAKTKRDGVSYFTAGVRFYRSRTNISTTPGQGLALKASIHRIRAHPRF